MKFPALKEIPVAREMISTFGGYNHNLMIGDGEFYDMTNLSSDHYPVLSPRPRRGISLVSEDGDIQGIAGKGDRYFTVVGGGMWIDGFYIPLGLTYENPKTLIPMGAFLIIMPDKKYVNVEDPAEWGDIEETVTVSGVSYELCKIDGAGYDDVRKGTTAPTITEAMKNGTEKLPLWLDTSGVPHALKQYSTSEEQWISVATTYVKISAEGIGERFSVYDGVTISGIDIEGLSDLNDSAAVIWATGENFIVVTGFIDETSTQDGAITVKRTMPDMDFVIESENRLWGCKYGNGVNEIYASKLGDFKNWNCFMGVSTDSYAASVGSDGPFTGAITFLGHPMFFKEDCVHKIYGHYPSNFQIQTTVCRGVQPGCSRSLTVVNEMLYYKARSAICAYDGSLPVEVSSALGDISYSNAVAGHLGNKYYVSMEDSEKKHHLFVYDTKKGMWHREDDTQVVVFCHFRGNLYYIDYAAPNCLKVVRGEDERVFEDATYQWEAVTGIIGTDSPDKKYISRMDVRMSLEIGTEVMFFAEYDSCGDWEHLFTMTGSRLGSFAVPLRPKRCDHLRLKIVGKGEAKIYSICKTVEQGSDA